MRKSLVGLAFLCAAFVATPSFGQTAIPQSVIDAAIAGTPDGEKVLQAYITGNGAKAGITDRAVALIRQLQSRAASVDGDLLRVAATRIYGDAMQAVGGAQVAKTVVDPAFVPASDSIAWDFGSAQKPPAPGFQRVAPQDARLTGDGMQLVEGLDSCALCADGITKVQRIVIPVRSNEPFRVTLFTENRGDRSATQSPFGQSIAANGTEFPVQPASAAQWLEYGYLSNGRAPNQLQDSAAGTITFEVRPVDGQIVLELKDNGDGSALGANGTFLTALLAEPVARRSSLALTPVANPSYVALGSPIVSANTVLADALGNLFNDVATAAGQPPPPPTLPVVQQLADNAFVASPN